MEFSSLSMAQPGSWPLKSGILGWPLWDTRHHAWLALLEQLGTVFRLWRMSGLLVSAGGPGMKQQNWCGLTAKMGTVLSGVFSIMATHMHLIFERRHLGDGNCTDSLQSQDISVVSHFIICWSFKIVLCASLITMAVSCFLLYSVYAQIYGGLMVYTIWIFTYESTNLAIQIFTDDFSVALVRAMRWFGWVSRASLHSFCLYFVVSHAQIIYQSKKQGNILTYHRRLSLGIGDTPRQKSKIISFIHQSNN
ncbi:transmembrane protein 217 isoform X1 [Mesocricetus auratus]|uniref:Transmembrane protein 217 isoform X1 n=1 Tax=Mesocricetus auratus TaxID=10036 RepID=A0A1U7RB10_MESAU|nr:transmembrane protein 217 isoform X1 [Mesocricetus auratus]